MKNQSSHGLHDTKRVWDFISTKLVMVAGKWMGKEKVPHRLCSEILCSETYLRLRQILYVFPHAAPALKIEYVLLSPHIRT